MQKQTTGGRAQRLVSIARPKKAVPYFGKVTAFVVRAKVEADERVLKSGDRLSEDEAQQRLAEALRRQGLRVLDQPSKEAAYVNLWLELSEAPDARRYGYRLAVTKQDVDLASAFERDVPAYLRDRRTGTISVAGHGGREADLSLIESLAEDVAKLVPKAKRTDMPDNSPLAENQGNLAMAEAFVVRTRFDFDRSLQARKGFWTAGSAKAYLTKLLRERGLNVVESPQEADGPVAYVNHWIKGKAKRSGSDGFDYRYEAFYAVTESEREYKPIQDSQDTGSGAFAFFEEAERAELERYADELAQAYEGSRTALSHSPNLMR